MSLLPAPSGGPYSTKLPLLIGLYFTLSTHVESRLWTYSNIYIGLVHMLKAYTCGYGVDQCGHSVCLCQPLICRTQPWINTEQIPIETPSPVLVSHHSLFGMASTYGRPCSRTNPTLLIHHSFVTNMNVILHDLSYVDFKGVTTPWDCWKKRLIDLAILYMLWTYAKASKITHFHISYFGHALF